mmetsp:Transcript_49474/g.49840  ORF Transcript_49474/g.49840 Transcript_49474/m.49840 type:complete len:121 (+) Transcript_49474:112-474(+)
MEALAETLISQSTPLSKLSPPISATTNSKLYQQWNHNSSPKSRYNDVSYSLLSSDKSTNSKINLSTKQGIKSQLHEESEHLPKQETFFHKVFCAESLKDHKRAEAFSFRIVGWNHMIFQI